LYKKDKSALNEVNLISSYRRIGSLMRSFGIEEKSIECYRKALDLAIELYKKDKTAIDNEEILNIYGVLGELYTDKNDVENMKKYFYYFLVLIK